MQDSTIHIEQTYKALDVEEKIDLLFYRKVGFRVAKIAERIGVTPNAISVIGISIGCVAGHFFYYDALWVNVIGMLLWVVSNICDSADGQLARMTANTSELGRVLDGLGGGLVFFSMYVHIALRYVNEGGQIGYWILAVALLAGLSHSIQSAMADYFRNAYLRYGTDEGKGELTDASEIEERYHGLSWRAEPLVKFGMRVYLNYTRQQEYLSPGFQKFRAVVDARWKGGLPIRFRESYRALNLPLLKYYNYLTINGRVLTLFAFVLAGFPVYFFPVEIIGMNALLVIVMRVQDKRFDQLVGQSSRFEVQDGATSAA